MLIRIRTVTWWSSTWRAETQPVVPFGRIGRLSRYQSFPSASWVAAIASTSWYRKSVRNWWRTSTRPAFGFGALRATATGTVSSPAAGSETATSRALLPASAPGATNKQTIARRSVDPTNERRLTAVILGNGVGRRVQKRTGRIPRVEHEADAGPVAGIGLDLELAAEHLDALEHALEPV